MFPYIWPATWITYAHQQLGHHWSKEFVEGSEGSIGSRDYWERERWLIFLEYLCLFDCEDLFCGFLFMDDSLWTHMGWREIECTNKYLAVMLRSYNLSSGGESRGSCPPWIQHRLKVIIRSCTWRAVYLLLNHTLLYQVLNNGYPFESATNSVGTAKSHLIWKFGGDMEGNL